MSLSFATTLILFSATMYLWIRAAFMQVLGHKNIQLLLGVYNYKSKILLVVHAIKDCDTTCRLFEIGKSVAFKRPLQANDI
jgi:hypothetical protein